MNKEIKQVVEPLRTETNVVMRDKMVLNNGSKVDPEVERAMENDTVTKEYLKGIKKEMNDGQVITISNEEEIKMTKELMNEHVLTMGIGAAGANVSHLAKLEGFMTCGVNTSEDDLKGIDVHHKFIFEQSFGSGKERRRSKEKFIENADSFIQFFGENFKNQKTVVIIHSNNGGTGGGSAPMAAKFLKDNYPDRNVFLISIAGSIKEDIKSQENGAAVLEEITKAGVNYMVFDNDKVKGNIDQVYDTVNKEIIAAMKFIAREHFRENNRHNIDLTDMQKIYLPKKRMVIVSGNFDRRVSGNCDYEQQMLDAIKASTQLAPVRTTEMTYAFFLNVEEALYGQIDTNFRKISENLGESYETYKHLQQKIDDAPDFTICISGLAEPVERYELINKRIEEFLQVGDSVKSISEAKRVVIPGRENVNNFKLPEEEAVSEEKPSGINKSAFSDFV